MSSKQHYVKLNDGHLIPALGFGTYKPKEVRIQDCQYLRLELIRVQENRKLGLPCIRV